MTPFKYRKNRRSPKARTLPAWMLAAVCLLSCCTREETVIMNDPSPELSQLSLRNLSINNWIWDVMSEVYYWKESMPADPAEMNLEKGYGSFMESLIDPDDEYSYYAVQYDTATSTQTDIDTTMGFSYVVGEFSNRQGTYFVVIEFTYPGSGASEAGLKRGDILLEINGMPITEDNYADLFTLRTYEVTVGRYYPDYNYIAPTSTITLTAKSFMPWPVLMASKISSTWNKVIGYMAYAQCNSGVNGAFNESLDYYIDQLASKGVNVLILDLRYNRGGDLGAARYLASCLAPQWARENHEILVNMEWNPYLNELLKSVQGENSDYLNIKFLDNTSHLNLSALYILTTGRTASASELIIAGLKPYLDVTTVGSKTYGKYYGLYRFVYDGEFKSSSWAIVPVVNRYRNIRGEPEVDGGIPADIQEEESLLLGDSLGSRSDPVIDRVMTLIRDGKKSATPGPAIFPSGFHWINEDARKPGSNLILNGAVELDLPLLKNTE